MVGSDSRWGSAGGDTGTGSESESAPGIDVLHVDDDPAFVEVAGELLAAESDRLSVETVTDPRVALERATDGTGVDCVVSDHEMPEMDGLELLAAVRAERPELPFVLFTGAGSERLASEAISAGVDDYVRKGDAGQYALLANRIENAVEGHRDAAEAERTRRRFRALVEDSSDAVTVVDGDGVFQYVAPSVERVWGYAPGELLGESGVDYVHPEDRDRVRAELDDFLAEGDPVSIEFRFRHGEEGWRWMESRARDRRDDPLVDGIVVHTRDVTERKEREDRLQGLLDLSGDVVTVLDDEGVIRYQSPSVERVMGYDRDETVGDRALAYVHPEDRQLVRRAFDSMVDADAGGPGRVEYRFRHADGSWRWMESLASPREDAAVEGYVVTSRDVTEARRRKRDLERYREIVETAGDAMFALDREGEIRMANAAFAEISGIPEDEMVGTHATEYIGEADYRRGTEALLGVLDDEDTVRGRFEFTGGDFPESHRRFETIITPITDDDGGLAGSVGVVRDVTEHRERERELERTNERLRTIVDNVPVVLFALDGDGTFTLSEGRALSTLGLEPGEAVGDSVFDMYADSPRILDASRRALDGERTHVTTEVAGHAFETWFEPVSDGGAVDRVVGVAIDVTERRERERELERQNERLDRFASLVSHDLRNHLQVAAGRVEAARHDPDPENVLGIKRAVDRIADVVEDLTTLAREGGTVAEGDTDPVPLVAVATTCWSGIDAPGVDLRVEDDLVVEADRSKLRQLVENLLRNSVEHGDGSQGDAGISRVEIGALGDADEEAGTGPEGFYVADDGVGIPPGERSSVFDPGYSAAEDGSGFGLFIVREIARAHGWTVAVEESDAGGARFAVRTGGR